jgi:hypothetical protein
MLTAPSIDDLLEGVIIGLQNEIIPALSNPKDIATAGMMQAVIQQVRQTLANFDIYLADEHNGMTETLRKVAAELGGATGPEADAIRTRAATLGARPNLPIPLPRAEVAAAHNELGDALVDTLTDLDTLQRAGNSAADRALEILRAHWGPRYKRDVETMLVGAGMIGRG